MVEALQSAVLGGIPHGFMTRRGGLSTGVVAGLNCGLGTGDDDQAVAANRRLATEAVLPGARLVSVYQVHSADAVVVDQPWDEAGRPRADALVTKTPGLLLGIVTADCAPVLLADPQAGVIGAAHAGWRGALDGVLEAALAAMEGLGASRGRIVAAIGPCIAQASYEVDTGFRAHFAPDDGRFFRAGNSGHFQFDLPGYVAARLVAAGVAQVDSLALDTYADPGRFYSYRRATHRGEADYGRQLSLIGLPGQGA